nr:short-chain dehydrogenase [Virgibacillus doumboii]
MESKYALVIGGSGMLKKVCHWLNENGFIVYVIGRNQDKLQKVKYDSMYAENLHGVSTDYQDNEHFTDVIGDILETNGIPQIVVSWIHSTAPEALPLIKDMIMERNLNSVWRLFHVQGSSRFFEKENTPVPDNCLYRRVYLGFILENNHSRWLTHDEISDGVIQAIASDNEETVVGTLEPWSKRP